MSENADSIQHRSALKRVAAELSEVDAQAVELRAQRKELIVASRELGMTYSDIASALGVTRAYVHQQVHGAKGSNGGAS